MANYFDKDGNYINVENLSLAEIYNRGYQDGSEDGLQDIRPKGKWKETGYETGALGITYRQTQCSNCGWEQAMPMWLNFCANCGADMRKGGTE